MPVFVTAVNNVPQGRMAKAYAAKCLDCQLTVTITADDMPHKYLTQGRAETWLREHGWVQSDGRWWRCEPCAERRRALRNRPSPSPDQIELL